MIDAELSVPYRLNPPGIDASGEALVLNQVVIQWSFLHDLPAGEIDQNGIVLHVSKLGGADQAISGARERRTDQQNVGCRKELFDHLVSAQQERF